MKARLLLGGVVLAITSASTAFAQSAGDDAAARALFEEARKLVVTGNLAAACPKFAEGQRIAPGIGMLFNLGDCYEKQGKTASAWTAFTDVAGMAKAQGQPEREKAARQRADALAPRVPRLKIVVPPKSEVEGLELARDGTAIGRAQWGVLIPVDPGAHEVAATAPRRLSTTVRITAVEGKEQVAEIPFLEPAPVAPAPVVVAPPPTVAPAPPAEDPSRGNSQRAIGVVTGAVGLVGIGLGVTYGLMASSKKDEADQHCVAGDLCDADGISLRRKATGRADVSTVGFIAGGALLTLGVVLYLTAPRAASRLGLRADGVMVRF